MDTNKILICNSATEKSTSHTIKSNSNCYYTVAWISRNQLACGCDDGTIEIHEIESPPNKKLTTNLLWIAHGVIDEQRYSISLLAIPSIPTLRKKSAAVKSIVWNEESNLLASSGTDRQVKVFQSDFLKCQYSNQNF